MFKQKQWYQNHCTVHYALVDEYETRQTCAATEHAAGIKTEIIVPFPGKLLKTRQVR